MTRRWLGLVLIAGMLIFSAVVYSSLPDVVPTHWNFRGEVDGWSSRFWGALLAPLFSLALWLLLPLLRRIDPRRLNYEKFEPTFNVVINAVVLIGVMVHLITLGAGLGWPFDPARAVLVMMGLLFIVLGNIMPRLRSNWWMGIRTPWTLESDSVWRTTHRFGGYTFVIAGVLTMAAAALLPADIGMGVAFTSIMLGALAPAVYSYVAWRRERRDTGSV